MKSAKTTFGILILTFTFIFSSYAFAGPKPSKIKPGKIESVKIGEQIWMANNLNVTTFRNGETIPEAKTDEEWKAAGLAGTPAWRYYGNDPSTEAQYGKLYNWFAVNDTRGLAPKGWHIPTDAEWTQLTDYLGGLDVAGAKLKSKEGWKDNGNGTNESGFSGLPGGSCDKEGKSFSIGSNGGWWCITEVEPGHGHALGLSLIYSDGLAYRKTPNKKFGNNVRCVKD